MSGNEYTKLFFSMHPDFFGRSYIRDIPESEVFEEMMLELHGDGFKSYQTRCEGDVRFGFFAGNFSTLLEAVAEVEPEWVKLYGENDRVYCAFLGDRLASFCIVEDMGEHEFCGKRVKIGGPGCVGTVPLFRNKGLGLEMVSRATRILSEEGFDYSYIHYTGVAEWYAKLGYKPVISWCGKGILHEFD